MDLDWNALSQMEAGEVASVLLEYAEHATLGCTPDQEDRVLATLPEPIRVVWVLSWLDFEVSQGSLLAYFFNSAGRHATTAVSALETIGAPRMDEVLRKAVTSDSATAAEWDQRRDQINASGEFAVVHPYKGLSNADEMVTLTDEYWVAAAEDSWGEQLDRYLQGWISREAQS